MQSKLTLIITSLAIFKITYDIFNDVSLNIIHVVTLIILFFFLGFFNFDKTTINDK
jgi:SSS family solute:Na+ symporter